MIILNYLSFVFNEFPMILHPPKRKAQNQNHSSVQKNPACAELFVYIIGDW